MEHLYDRLEQYAKGDVYPFHMPGHKRRTFGAMPREALSMDITEIDGFDDLHCPEGILKELQERIARLYGAQESFCLVNGSTAGILSALSAALPEGGHLLMARNCHKSAYHAAYLRNLKVTYLMPPVLPEFGICDGITPVQVQEALEADPKIQAVLIVSPTYEGRISPIREIAEAVHAKGKILIVDEAHGAHLGLSPAFHENSCQAGADLVIHSVHKTLPAMTQTALLHVNGQRVDLERLRRFLRIYQSSSPSYVLMASIDNAISMMEQGEELCNTFVREFSDMNRRLAACRHFRFLSPETAESQDVGKLVIHGGSSGLTGQQIYDVLRDQYHLQLEMAAGEYCLAMFTVGDTHEGYERMTKALLAMDEAVSKGTREDAAHTASAEQDLGPRKDEALADASIPPMTALPLREAWDSPWELVSIDQCQGRTAAEFVNFYPPGTPLVVPGEVFTIEILGSLKRGLAQGLRVRGIEKRNEKDFVRCLKA
ncbi:MAG: aminotransferase class I/II-fold pyridoxal phosphate-dependent enzyme [Lachnospiraceae bacterium]|nr:aminotransferase class I/II-fold pyridoxal phosphate-dependent enzyme [Lachnospiraceae bacterium]